MFVSTLAPRLTRQLLCKLLLEMSSAGCLPSETHHATHLSLVSHPVLLPSSPTGQLSLTSNTSNHVECWSFNGSASCCPPVPSAHEVDPPHSGKLACPFRMASLGHTFVGDILSLSQFSHRALHRGPSPPTVTVLPM